MPGKQTDGYLRIPRSSLAWPLVGLVLAAISIAGSMGFKKMMFF